MHKQQPFPDRKHVEGFCHMTYRSDDGLESVRIWNSRDGVTPFVITIPGSNKQATHVAWNDDQCDPNYKPQPGDLVFIDLTEEKAREYATQRAQEYWNSPTGPDPRQSGYKSPDELAESLFRSYMEHPGAPDLARVNAYGGYENVW